MGALDGLGKRAKKITKEYNAEQEQKIEEKKNGEQPTPGGI